MFPIWVWVFKLLLFTNFFFYSLFYNRYHFYYIWYWSSYYTPNFYFCKINNSKKVVYIKYINLFINSVWTLSWVNKRNYWMI
uniref:NADH dehydrogenase subunit 3 n=1 Tax=Nilaparvata muiri TaxID=706586 RepID=A0A075B916_NILMU|nr:NADH dehydrogenase subunit 3 [Nilaparvata muiri]AEP27297.1 NADH dehydrogenase subunit 3 [Nilaparvata muiri]